MKPIKDKKYFICFQNEAWDDLNYRGVATFNGEIEPNEGWFGFNIEGEKETIWFAEEDIVIEFHDQQIKKDKCFAVIDIHGRVVDKSATLERAKDRKWELENEHPDYLGQKLIILETTW